MSVHPDADAALIENDIVRTQDRMGDTVQHLEAKLTPAGIARSAIGDKGGRTATQAVEVAKRNPVAVGLIAVGVIWLIASRRSRDLISRIVSGSRPGKRR